MTTITETREKQQLSVFSPLTGQEIIQIALEAPEDLDKKVQLAKDAWPKWKEKIGRAHV